MKPLVLCILDGVGIADAGDGNAVTRARMPFYDTLLANCPNTTLAASGPAVGLPPRTMGNSEVGHITIGAGRIVNQFLRRFQLAKPTLKKNAALKKFLGDAGRVHVLGLCSDGRVHASIDDSI
ncbi:MAG: 2,3-bisphosphoglycerate-independent phosphoglycerate mutase, partial [Rickettsiales bacterium]|nr:2,3-bisphosphoglycerate-independent phosphoglycerate mutase [Rickettsiales bacterium]